MPVPIKPIPDKGEPRNISDYAFLLNVPKGLPSKKKVQASNKDASLLFKIWAQGKKASEDSVKIKDLGISSRDIMRLKTMGFLTGGSEEVKFTKKGKIVITTMALGETSAFEKNKREKKYTEILASMNKKGKKGFRTPKFASCPSNLLNLRDL